MFPLRFIFGLLLLCLFNFDFTPNNVHGFIFWKANTTACDVCDGFDTNSGRNVLCCTLFSKCCGYQSLEEAELIRAGNITKTLSGSSTRGAPPAIPDNPPPAGTSSTTSTQSKKKRKKKKKK